MLELLQGVRRAGAVVNLAAAAVANATAIITLSTTANMQGVKSFRIKRLKIRNNNAGNTWVHIGTGAAGTYVPGIPALFSVANTTDDYVEGDLPAVNFTATITAYPDAVGAGSFDIQAEVEEQG